jgi:hypothetical protein
MNTESTIQTGSTRQGGADQNLRFHNLRPASPPGGVGPLPHSIDAEIALLGCLLLDPVQAFPVVMAENIVADHFYDMRYGKLFCLLRKLYRANGAFDMIVVTNALRDAGELDALGGVPMLSSMMNSVPSAASDVVKMYGDVLKDKKRRRYMIDVAHRLHQLASDVSVPSAPLLADMVDHIRGMEFVSSAEKNLSLRTPAEVLALPSDQQDNILGDRLLAKGQSLTIVGAGGIGKSRLLLQLAVACILGRPFIGMKTHARNLRWLIFQAENSVRRLQRDLSALQSWSRGDWNDVNDRLLIHTLENSGDCFLNLDNPRTRQRIADVIERHEADVICFDPLNAFGSGDLNSDHDMRMACRSIAEIAQGSNPQRAIVVLHHALTGKLGASRALGYERSGFGRNSKLLHAWTRGQINLAPGKPDDNNTLVVSCGKCSNGEEFEPFAITLDVGALIYSQDHDFDVEDWQKTLGGGASLIESAQHDGLLHDICANHPSRKDAVEKLRARLQCSASAAYNIITKAVEAGMIHIDGRVLKNARAAA